MNEKEALRRIRDHNRIHAKKEPCTPFLNEAMTMAMDALDKQTPRKPIRPYGSNYKQYWNCPTCGNSGMCDVHKYCWRCGQKLDWEES